jgi:hypothetical protein
MSSYTKRVHLIYVHQTKYENDDAMVEASRDIKHLSSTMDQSIAGESIPISSHLESRVRVLQRSVAFNGSEISANVPVQYPHELQSRTGRTGETECRSKDSWLGGNLEDDRRREPQDRGLYPEFHGKDMRDQLTRISYTDAYPSRLKVF